MPLSNKYFEHQFETLQKNVRNNGNKSILVHVDGSEESFITAAFCVRTMGLENVYALITPDIATKHILAAAQCASLGVRTYTIPVTLPVADILNQIKVAGISVSPDTTIRSSVMIANDVAFLVSKELDSYLVNKYYLNDHEYQEFVRLYGLPELEEEKVHEGNH